MKIKIIEDISKVNFNDLVKVIELAPLGKREPEKLKIAFKNSMYRVFLYDEDKLIGACRVVSDGVDCAVLCDVVLLPNYHGLGYGQKMIKHILSKIDEYQKIILYAVPNKEEFYKQFGFKEMTTAMAIFKNRDAEKIYTKE